MTLTPAQSGSAITTSTMNKGKERANEATSSGQAEQSRLQPALARAGVVPGGHVHAPLPKQKGFNHRRKISKPGQGGGIQLGSFNRPGLPSSPSSPSPKSSPASPSTPNRRRARQNPDLQKKFAEAVAKARPSAENSKIQASQSPRKLPSNTAKTMPNSSLPEHDHTERAKGTKRNTKKPCYGFVMPSEVHSEDEGNDDGDDETVATDTDEEMDGC